MKYSDNRKNNKEKGTCPNKFDENDNCHNCPNKNLFNRIMGFDEDDEDDISIDIENEKDED